MAEIKTWEMQNHELLSAYKDAKDSDVKDKLLSAILGRFENDSCRREGETTDNALFARQFGNFVNGRMQGERVFDRVSNTYKHCAGADVVAEKMANEHRYLQGVMFDVCAAYIKKLAENYKNGVYDARNKYAAETSNMIVEALKEKDWWV